MRIILGVNKRAGLSKEVHYLGVCLEDLCSRETINICSKASRVIDRTIDFSPFHLPSEHARFSKRIINRSKLHSVFLAHHKVVVPVAGAV